MSGSTQRYAIRPPSAFSNKSVPISSSISRRKIKPLLRNGPEEDLFRLKCPYGNNIARGYQFSDAGRRGYSPTTAACLYEPTSSHMRRILESPNNFSLASSCPFFFYFFFVVLLRENSPHYIILFPVVKRGDQTENSHESFLNVYGDTGTTQCGRFLNCINEPKERPSRWVARYRAFKSPSDFPPLFIASFSPSRNEVTEGEVRGVSRTWNICGSRCTIQCRRSRSCINELKRRQPRRIARYKVFVFSL